MKLAHHFVTALLITSTIIHLYKQDKRQMLNQKLKLHCESLGLQRWIGEAQPVSLTFFFSNAARTITALTVMRSGRKLRHLDIVGSHPKQNKHKQTNKNNPKQTHPNKPTKGLPKKARPRVKRCETCGNATLKLKCSPPGSSPKYCLVFCPKLESFQLPAMHLSHISKHFRKGGFLLLRAAFIHLILRISTWAIIGT